MEMHGIRARTKRRVQNMDGNANSGIHDKPSLSKYEKKATFTALELTHKKKDVYRKFPVFYKTVLSYKYRYIF